MNRRYLLISFLCILALAGCSGISSKQKNIYANNKQIAEETDTYTYLTRVASEDSIENINQINLEFSKFYGTDTLWSIESSGKHKLELSYNSEISKGKFKAVLVTAKEEVLNLFEGTDEGIIVLDLDEGKYRLKIVGKDAKGNIQIDIEESISIELKKMSDLSRMDT